MLVFLHLYFLQEFHLLILVGIFYTQMHMQLCYTINHTQNIHG